MCLPRWWSDTQCVRPANAVLAVFSWAWITSKQAEVHVHFTCSLIPVNSHFAKVHSLLPRRAKVVVEYNCGTSLNLAVCCGYRALNVAHTPSSMLIIVGHILQYSLDDDALLLLLCWIPLPCLQLLLGLIPAVQGHISSSPSTFLASLNERAKVHQHYACTRVLPGAACKGQGSPHYSVLMKCWFSHSELLYKFRFCTAGHILLSCCALVQQKIP